MTRGNRVGFGQILIVKERSRGLLDTVLLDRRILTLRIYHCYHLCDKPVINTDGECRILCSLSRKPHPVERTYLLANRQVEQYYCQVHT